MGATSGLRRRFDPAGESPETGEAYLSVEGGVRLEGEVAVPGAKNAALPAIVAACLSREETLLRNVPTRLTDIRILIELLRSCGASIRETEDHALVCSGAGWRGGELDASATRRLRASLYLLGLGAYWRTPVSQVIAGGCALGPRKHDLHVLALQAMGFEVEESDAGLSLAPGAEGADAEVAFRYPSFGATLNVVFAAVGRSGRTTVLHNAARNPEVADVVALLRGMGADIEEMEGGSLRVRGAGALRGTEHSVMSDRIVAGTVIAGTAVTRGETLLRGATLGVLEAEVSVWREAGLRIDQERDGVRVSAGRRLRATTVQTAPYPGFHTDIQPLHAAMMSVAEGRSVIRETILDTRFEYAPELRALGARIAVVDAGFLCPNGKPGQEARIDGVERLRGGRVTATDIRGGAAVAVAALAADGETRIYRIDRMDRGYEDIAGLFTGLKARIRRVDAR